MRTLFCCVDISLKNVYSDIKGLGSSWRAHTQSVSLTEGTKYREEKVVHLHRLLTLALQASLLHTPYVWVVRDRDQGWCT